MKKITALAAAFLALLIAIPLMAAAFVVSSATAVAQTVQCTSVSLPATGQWRPPFQQPYACLLYTSPSPRDRTRSRMPSSA